ncbi:hypothetical protein D9757_004882 [Collybiopsis confluens]|uniref:Uncharacterized protein n=1 Tax=Collybiopsis confluens TaxID=2823264 RepID=A0A8H5HTE4_9AGAR|nr:hypothetical protein D9757_004882 [Collybiopsis confluens]
MSKHDLQVLDTFETPDYIKGELSDDGRGPFCLSLDIGELDIPQHMVPPNPDDSDNSDLPSHVHPSYPYGNPKNIKHPASRPRPLYDPTSRALFEDMGYEGNGVAGALRWKDLALDQLLPVDEKKEMALKAAEARKMASGTGSQNPHGQQPTALAQDDQINDEAEEGDDEENDENEDDEDEDEDEDEDDSVEDEDED